MVTQHDIAENSSLSNNAAPGAESPPSFQNLDLGYFSDYPLNTVENHTAPWWLRNWRSISTLTTLPKDWTSLSIVIFQTDLHQGSVVFDRTERMVWEVAEVKVLERRWWFCSWSGIVRQWWVFGSVMLGDHSQRLDWLRGFVGFFKWHDEVILRGSHGFVLLWVCIFASLCKVLFNFFGMVLTKISCLIIGIWFRNDLILTKTSVWLLHNIGIWFRNDLLFIHLLANVVLLSKE